MSKPKASAATELVTLAARLNLEWFVNAFDGVPHVTLPREQEIGPRTMPVMSKQFREWLSLVFFRETQKAVTAASLKDALGVLCAKARDCGAQPIYVRTAGLAQDVFLHLGDAQQTIIHVTASGWDVADDAVAPKFVVKPGMLALPMPVRPVESLDAMLPKFLNLKDEHGVRLVIGWLVCALRAKQPYLLLFVRGESGSAKSSQCNVLRAIIDPSSVNGGRPFKDTRDLMIAATSQHVVSQDNLSFLDNDMADDYCALATGAGFRTRELHSDADEKLFSVARPVLFNGIPNLLQRSDLAGRALVVNLVGISPDARLTDTEATSRFSSLQPQCLGALLDAVSCSLRPIARPTRLPRMAEAALTVHAAEDALGWPSGTFLKLMDENDDNNSSAILEDSVVLDALKKLTLPWAGEVKDVKHLMPPTWSAKRVNTEISRLLGPLRKQNIYVVLPTRQDNRAAPLRGKRIVYVTAGADYNWTFAEIAQQLEDRASEAVRRASQPALLPVDGDDDIPF